MDEWPIKSQYPVPEKIWRCLRVNLLFSLEWACNFGQYEWLDADIGHKFRNLLIVNPQATVK